MYKYQAHAPLPSHKKKSLIKGVISFRSNYIKFFAEIGELMDLHTVTVCDIISPTICNLANKRGPLMYINRLLYRNIDPIEDLDLEFHKNAQGNPLPTIFVGKNGSGKSILLSNIVDAFYEFSGKVYNNSTKVEQLGHQFYKIMSSNQIRIGANYMLSYIKFEQNTDALEYIFKSGDLDFNQFILDNPLGAEFNWNSENNYKNVAASEECINEAFEKSIVCFFEPNRYMKPNWMGDKYFSASSVYGYSLRERINKQLSNPITADNVPEYTLQWLFDVITDSRADLLKQNDANYSIAYPSTSDLDLLTIARNNIESVMSAILDEPVVFRINNRSMGSRRLAIHSKNDGQMIVPSLDALSTGQLALFNLFATIIRYADTEDINLSFRNRDITGIVVIDEIELHLHSQLQREVLPKLIALFPKIQFIVTSHSPLFLFGMKAEFGEDGFEIIEVPSGQHISAEQFSEFENGYRYMKETEKYHQEIKAAIDQYQNKTLIVTEGSTDWKHMKTAYEHLLNDPQYTDWLSQMEFEFLEYEPKNSSKENCTKLEMGNSQLISMCEQYSKINQPRKIVFIADADDYSAKNKLSKEGEDYKSWGNNVYSMVIPVPEHRKDTPAISIEHYYTDDELKKEVIINGTKRRLFMENEFSENGISLDKQLDCIARGKCGPNKIGIIDGDEKKSCY